MDNQLFYIIHPSQLDFSSVGMSLQDRRNRLGELVRTRGAEWAALRMRGAEFLAAVEKLDRFLGAAEELVDSAFENSPRQMLPIGSTDAYSPLFGYYEPERVRGLDQRLRAIPAAIIQGWDDGPEGDNIGRVVHAFRSTFAEAAKRGHAVAVEHS
jgi:hypothetical protein